MNTPATQNETVRLVSRPKEMMYAGAPDEQVPLEVPQQQPAPDFPPEKDIY